MHLLTTALAALPVGALCAWLVDHVSVPFAWIALVVTVYCAWGFCRTPATLGKIVWLNVGAVVLVCGMLEVVLWRMAPPGTEFEPGYLPSDGFVRHAEYGYGPAVSSRTHVRKVSGKQTLYDVVYTIDDQGRRVSPPELGGAARRGCVVFFGCSNTYGEGVEDDETMPWRVGVVTGGRYATRNFGFSGWGPHQMLAMLQNGDAERRAECDVTHVVYFALYWHALRVAGRAPWDQRGPRYVLGPDGGAVRAGQFSDAHGAWLTRPLLDRLHGSFFYRKFLGGRLDPFERPTTPPDLDLMAAIVARARDEAAVRFPRASFDVLFWDMALAPNMVADVTTRLERRGLTVHPLSRAIPDYHGETDIRYTLSEVDRHPTPVAYALIAEYVATEILHAGDVGMCVPLR